MAVGPKRDDGGGIVNSTEAWLVQQRAVRPNAAAHRSLTYDGEVGASMQPIHVLFEDD